ncbi:Hypotetical protein [Gulosibacter molinativorax]|nr:Hypotetical protein [Gulosibacter molinativorax]
MKGRSLQKWEYFITPLPVHTPGAILNNWGKQGWELVQIVMNEQGGSVAYMKRPLDAEPTTTEETNG